MGKPSRDKGLRRERQIVDKHMAVGISAKKVSGMYKSGHDVEVWPLTGNSYPLKCEVKGRANGGGFATIERWLGDLDALFLVRDRQEPLVVLPMAVWLDVIGGGCEQA